MHLVSALRSGVRYDLRGSTFLCSPGETEVTGAQLIRLWANSAFKKHVAGGHVVVVAPESAEPPPPADEPPPPADEPEPANLRDRLPNESNKAYKARLAALDAQPPADEPEPVDHAKLFAEWDGFDQPTRDALWPSLKPEEQVAIQNREAPQ